MWQFCPKKLLIIWTFGLQMTLWFILFLNVLLSTVITWSWGLKLQTNLENRKMLLRCYKPRRHDSACFPIYHAGMFRCANAVEFLYPYPVGDFWNGPQGVCLGCLPGYLDPLGLVLIADALTLWLSLLLCVDLYCVGFGGLLWAVCYWPLAILFSFDWHGSDWIELLGLNIFFASIYFFNEQV